MEEEEKEKKSFEKFIDSQKYETMRGQVGSDVAAKKLAEEMEAQQELHGLDTVESASEDSVAHLYHLSPRLSLPQSRHMPKHWWSREAAQRMEPGEYSHLMHSLSQLLFEGNHWAFFDSLTRRDLAFFAVEITSCRANILTMAQIGKSTFSKHFNEQMAIMIKDFDRIIQDDDARTALKVILSAMIAIVEYRAEHSSNRDILEIQPFLQGLAPDQQQQLLSDIDSLMEPVKIYKELTKRKDVDADQITRIGI